MNNQQMAMLGVKSTIERNVFGLMSMYRDKPISIFWNEVNKSVALLFVSFQIDRSFSIDATHQKLSIEFETNGHHSFVEFLLPYRHFTTAGEQNSYHAEAVNGERSFREAQLLKAIIL